MEIKICHSREKLFGVAFWNLLTLYFKTYLKFVSCCRIREWFGLIIESFLIEKKTNVKFKDKLDFVESVDWNAFSAIYFLYLFTSNNVWLSNRRKKIFWYSEDESKHTCSPFVQSCQRLRNFQPIESLGLYNTWSCL